MSHHATNWAITQRGLKPATKIVLWQLADRHNPDQGCFPSQERLAYDCEMSRSTLNVHLNTLEEMGLIARKQAIDKITKRQLPTRYFLAFEEGFEPCPKSGHGAVSEKPEKPSPDFAQSRVRIPDSNPVREPVREPTPLPPEGDGAAAPGRGFDKLWEGWDAAHLPENRAYAEKLFRGLTDIERDQALEVAQAYIQLCQRRGNHPQMVPYLKERRFLDLVGAPEIDQDGDFIITPQRPEWRPWMGELRKKHGAKVVEGPKGPIALGRVVVKTRWPEGHVHAG